ncbi:Myb/SANT-like transcription factor, partial [Oryctes borbonicus]
MEIDNELLITLVEERIVLWDKTAEDYKNRNKTLEAWKQICKVLKYGYDEMSEKEQNEIGKQVIKRWTNIKDSFLRWLKKYNDTIRSGAAANMRLRKYVYHDQLLFLKRVAAPNDTEDSLDDTVTVNEKKETSDNDTSDGRRHKTNDLEIQSRPKRKDKRTTTFEERMIKTFEATPTPAPSQQTQDRHMAFFAGIIPALGNFNEDQICDFQIGVLQLIQSLKRTRMPNSSNNAHLCNHNFHFEEAAPHAFSINFHSSMPYHLHHEQTARQIVSTPLHCCGSPFHFCTGQEVSQNSTPHNSEATYTMLPIPTRAASIPYSAVSTKETNILSPSHSTVSSE